MTTRTRLAALALATVAFVAAACGSDPATTTATADASESYAQQLDERAETALEATPEAAPTAVPVQPATASETAAATTATDETVATPVAAVTPEPAERVVTVPEIDVPQVGVPEVGVPEVTVPEIDPPQVAAAQPGSSYDGVLPRWFQIPPGFTPTGAELRPGDVEVLTIAGELSVDFSVVCADFEAQARAAGLPALSGTCNDSTLIYGSDNAKATAQTFGGSTGEFVFIGFELVAPATASTPPPPQPTPSPNPVAPPSATTTGVFPNWYVPPAQLVYVSHYDKDDGERRIQTNLGGLDYVLLCNDFRDQAAAVGLLPTSSKQCNDPIIRWTNLEGSGAAAEIQDVENLSYDVLFVFDLASFSIGGNGTSSIVPSDDTTTPSTPAPTSSDDSDTDVLPAWFNPTVFGTELAHGIENGDYTIAAIGRIDSTTTYTSLCQEFERQADGAGWIRQSGDDCGEGIFDGATFADPGSGFEAQVRHRGDQIVYSFEVATGLTAAEITTIVFDPELALLPTGFSLVPGDQVIAFVESIDDTNAYNTSIRVQGPADFASRCERFLQEAGAVEIVLGGCDAPNEIVTITYRDTTVVFESDTYSFVTRS